MKVLFIHPAVHDFACHDFWLKPYGLLKLAGLFEQHGAQVHFFDFLDRFSPDVDPHFKKMYPLGRGRFPRRFISKPDLFKHVPRRFKRYGRELDVFKAYLKSILPLDAIFMTCTMTYWYPGVQELLPYLQKIPVYLGGSYATLLPNHARSLGLNVISNSELPAFLSRFGFTLEKLHRALPYWKGYSCLPYIITRLSWGCPFNCTYCAVKSFYPTYTVRDAEDVLEEISQSLRPETDHVVFYDDALLLQHEKLFDLCQKILRIKKVHFHTPNGLAIDQLTEKVAEGLARNNFFQIFLGYETSDDTIHEKMGSKTSALAFKTAAAALRKAAYPLKNVHAYLLMGHDLIAPASVEQSIMTVIREGIVPFLTEYSPIPGTEDGNRVLKYSAHDPLITNKTSWIYQWASVETINRLKRIAHSARKHHQGRKA